jgi:hypothetical protein
MARSPEPDGESWNLREIPGVPRRITDSAPGPRLPASKLAPFSAFSAFSITVLTLCRFDYMVRDAPLKRPILRSSAQFSVGFD